MFDQTDTFLEWNFWPSRGEGSGYCLHGLRVSLTLLDKVLTSGQGWRSFSFTQAKPGELGLLNLEKRRMRWALNICEYLKGRCKVNGTWPFSTVPKGRTSGNWYKLKHKRFCEYIRKYFFLWITKHWHRLPRQMWSLHSFFQKPSGHDPG